MKNVLCVVIFLLTLTPLAAQRAFLPANVELSPYYSGQQQLEEYLSQQGDKEPVNAVLKEALKSKTLSATLYTDRERYYLLTDGAVLRYASFTDISFKTPEKSYFLKQIPVNYIDSRSGLAIIELPLQNDELTLQPIEESQLKVGQSITLLDGNQNVVVNSLLTSRSARFNPVASGSLLESSLQLTVSQSGSALIGTSSADHYNLLGINIYSPQAPPYTAYALPFFSIRAAVERYNRFAENRDEEALLTEAADSFASALKKGVVVTDSKDLISTELAARWALSGLKAQLGGLLDDKRRWQGYISQYPADDLFRMTALSLLADVHNLEFRSVVALASNPRMEASTVAFYLGEQIITTEWRLIAGKWQLTSFPYQSFDQALIDKGDEPEQMAHKAVKRHYRGIFVGAGSLIGNYRPINVQLGYDVAPTKYFLFGFMLSYEGYPYKVNKEQHKATFFTPSVSARLQVPIELKTVNIVPFAGVRLGLPIALTDNLPNNSYYNDLLFKRNHVTMAMGWFAGLEVGFGRKSFIYLGMEMGYNQDFFSHRYFREDKGKASAYFGRSYIKFSF